MAECDVEWELCKENIQPLKQGRTISALHQALCQQQEGNHTALNQKKQAFESELRMYDGDDPLDVWVRYIKWTKQTFPQGGKESNLSVLLERAVMLFTADKKYHNDVRYVELWIEFAEGCSDPMDVFRYMQAQGIGTMQAALYISWSEEHEKRGNLKMADRVFQDGVKCGAEPVDKLQVFHRALQARVCRQMMSSMTAQQRDDDDDEDEEPQRSSLAELKAKGKKKAVVPINRVNASAGYARGLQFKQPLGPKHNSRPVIFDENKVPESVPQEPKFEIWTAPPTARAKENEQKPEKWSNVKLPLKSRSGLSVAVPPPKPSFQPFVEEDDRPPAVTPCKINPAVNSVLSARKPCRLEQTPMKMLQERQQLMQTQTQEDGKSREQSMYCRDLVYSGATEFCFEELRAERYWQKHTRKLQTNSPEDSSTD
ncbi:hypothetical protein PO909_012187 [Leuciscus waleckii]